MKFLFIIFISIILLSCESGVVNDEAMVRKTVSKFFECSAKEDYDCMYLLTHPASFQKFSKGEVISDLKQGMHNERYDIDFLNATIDSISNIFDYNESRYALVKAKASMTFTLKYVPNVNLNESTNQACKYFSDLYGAENVKCDSINNKIDVLAHDPTYVIYDIKYKKWFVLAANNHKSVARIIPRYIRDSLQYF